jgi:peptidoglycan/LPS O-acetylase OafA/YrhL
LATGFACYFVLGYLLSEITLPRTRIILSTAIWVIGALITILGTYFFTRNSGKFDGFFYDFVSLNVILASSAAFLLFRGVSERKPFTFPNLQTILRTVATSTFGIYLIHILAIEVLSGWIPFLHINSFMGNAIWSIPLVSAAVFTLSFFDCAYSPKNTDSEVYCAMRLSVPKFEWGSALLPAFPYKISAGSHKANSISRSDQQAAFDEYTQH